jgi:hypothetical protein
MEASARAMMERILTVFGQNMFEREWWEILRLIITRLIGLLMIRREQRWFYTSQREFFEPFTKKALPPFRFRNISSFLPQMKLDLDCQPLPWADSNLTLNSDINVHFIFNGSYGLIGSLIYARIYHRKGYDWSVKMYLSDT